MSGRLKESCIKLSWVAAWDLDNISTGAPKMSKVKLQVIFPKQYCKICNKVKTTWNKDQNCDYYIAANIQVPHIWRA